MTTDTPNETSSHSARPSQIEITLAALWILLPAVQYLGTYLRTGATVAREIPRGGPARLDLTPWYVVLLGLTLVFIIVKLMAHRSSLQSGEVSR